MLQMISEFDESKRQIFFWWTYDEIVYRQHQLGAKANAEALAQKAAMESAKRGRTYGR